MTEGRVLVVDDSAVTRALLVRTLSRDGFDVSEAVDGVDGAVKALSEQPDIVVTDLEMPTMDGYQLLRLLKSNAATAHIPVVILTSHEEAPSRFWGYQTGADGYLTKDLAPTEIVDLVRGLVIESADSPAPPSPGPRSSTDILALVAKTLDSTLLETTFINTLLERGIAAGDFDAALRIGLTTISEVVDAHVLAIGVVEPQLATLHMLVPESVAERTIEDVAKRLLESLPVMPGVPVEVVIHGRRDGLHECGLEGLFTLDLRLHNAAGCLAILPRLRPQFEQVSQPLVEASARHLGLVVDNSRLAQRLRELSMLDGLTRQLNHRSIHERLVAEINRAQRYENHLAVVICDLDHFKSVNDMFGHLAGDAVLQGVARAMRSALRAADSLGRFGGEEFLAILPESDLAAARGAAERLRCAVGGETIVLPSGEEVSVTVSLGAAAMHEMPGDFSADTLISLADTRLYEAKSAGRNCVRP